MARTPRGRPLQITKARLALVAAAAAVVLAGVLIAASGGDGTSSGTSSAGGAGTEGGALFDVELATLDGTPVRLDRYAGEPLVVNFFASWCGPCVREMPDFEAVHSRRGDEVRFVGVNLQDAPDAAATLVRQTGVTYDIVRDDRGSLFRAVNGFSMPTTVFVTAEGEIVDVHGGELTQRALEARMDRLLER